LEVTWLLWAIADQASWLIQGSVARLATQCSCYVYQMNGKV